MSFDRLKDGNPFAATKIPGPEKKITAHYFWRPQESQLWRYAGILLIGETTPTPMGNSHVCVLPDPPFEPGPTPLPVEAFKAFGEDGKLIEEKCILTELPPSDTAL